MPTPNLWLYNRYTKFWSEFGKSIKMGIMEDTPNRSKLAKLLRYKTSTSGEKLTGLAAYVERMPDWQTDIYFLAGESEDAITKVPPYVYGCILTCT